MPLRSKKLITRLLLAVGIPVLLAGACVLLGQIDVWRQDAALVAQAQRLGYTSRAEIARGTRCWSMWGDCDRLLFYTTTASLEEFRQQIAALPSPIQASQEYTASTLFFDLRNTNKLLLVDGSEPTEDITITDLMAYQWEVADEDRKISIYFYATAQSQAEYQLDNIPIRGNIISVRLHSQ